MADNTARVWLVETLRATAFGDTDIDQARSWWDKTLGDEPDSETTKSKLGQYSASIEKFGGILTLEVRPNRVDWLLRAKRSDDVEDLKFPSLAPFDEILPRFIEICNTWLDQTPILSRIAFGAVILMPVDDREQGYRKLDKYLPKLGIDVEGSSDLFYQINRPRQSKLDIDGMELNRLSKWSALRLTAGNIRFDSDEAVISKAQEDAIALRLELDISTSPKFAKPLPVNRLQDLFGELINLGSEIAELGDIP